ncbi:MULTISPECIES: KTSC domain-containing protein [unclassified Mesorhizobium]|uniref:KTSC domain-containing protein n=1 Tax=unclassified Mesorhizobium TaxID=325217 RepID=UPI0027B897CD|nr:KTSC domain-containing protein [Mesorhizobium sp. L48C026A00]
MASTLIGEAGPWRQGLGARRIIASTCARWNPDCRGGLLPRRVECWEMPSTVIQSINYDPATRTLSVWFVPSGNRYDFNDVPPQTYAAFRKAWSKGRFFNAFIRDRYSYHLVEQSPSG